MEVNRELYTCRTCGHMVTVYIMSHEVCSILLLFHVYMSTYMYMTHGTSDNGSLQCDLENRVGAALRAAGAVKS